MYHKHVRLIILFLVLGLMAGLSGCGKDEPPFPGTPPLRVVFGTPPPVVNPGIWFSDVKKWGAQAYMYHSPHFQGNIFREQAGLPLTYDGDDLKSVAYLSAMDAGFSKRLSSDELSFQEQLAQEAYEACRGQELDFYYSIPFPLFPVQDQAVVQEVHPELFDDSGLLNFAHPDLPAYLSRLIETLQAAMPEMKGINVIIGEGYGNVFAPTAADLDKVSEWLPALLTALDSTARRLNITAMIGVESIWHTVKSRRQVLEAVNQYPDLQFFTNATWPQETTRMPYLGYIPARDTLLLKKNPLAVNILTDTEFMGKGALPAVLPVWWQYLAQESYLRGAEMVLARAFIGDRGGSATNFNRLNVHLLLHFLEDPRSSPKPTTQMAAEEMFGSDFPSRLTAVMMIAEDAFQTISSVNYVNVLDESHFPPPQFLDKDYVDLPHRMKAIDDLFEAPGTPLYTEDIPMPDTLHAWEQWRWQPELIAQPVDEMLLGLENANGWLDRIQKEVEYLAIDFPPQHRQMLVGGYRDLLLYARGMYQFVQGGAVHHRWYRLERISQEEALSQLAPLAEQLRLIAADADGSVLDLQNRLLELAEAYEQLNIEPLAQ